jgi:16S rRNA (uracil1498-N3)-methyltransferase
MHVFFTSSFHGGILELDAEESRHCVKVLRMREGHSVRITDGRGRAWPAVLVQADPRGCMLEVSGEAYSLDQRPVFLHLAVAPTKNIDRFEWLLEKATECGIDRITPLICENSEREVVKTERLKKIIISAMKQSQRYWLPMLDEAVNFHDFINAPAQGVKLIAHCAGGEKKRLNDCYSKNQDAVILIGPEGDFSPGEVNQALGKGFSAITLGDHRLRTETAALALCIQVNTFNDLL